MVTMRDLTRVVIGVDPAVTHGQDADTTGIIVAGLGADADFYVLADLSCNLSPDGWARRVVGAFHEWEADRVVAEVNNGGELVTSVLRAVDRQLPVKVVHASRGKVVRAEPIAALYEQRRVHHVGSLPLLEDEMVAFPVANEHDDRVDALVYALTELSGLSKGHVVEVV